VEVDGAAKEPTSEKAAEGEDSDGTKSKFTHPLCMPILISDGTKSKFTHPLCMPILICDYTFFS
jgi:hypothetical protein